MQPRSNSTVERPAARAAAPAAIPQGPAPTTTRSNRSDMVRETPWRAPSFRPRSARGSAREADLGLFGEGTVEHHGAPDRLRHLDVVHPRHDRFGGGARVFRRALQHLDLEGL